MGSEELEDLVGMNHDPVEICDVIMQINIPDVLEITGLVFYIKAKTTQSSLSSTTSLTDRLHMLG